MTADPNARQDPKVLREEQERTLTAPRRRYGLLARALFLSMDALYGRRRTLSKFKVLEVVARVPYQAWEHVAYIALTHRYREPDFARRIFEFVREAREQQDNEQWHLLILEEMVHERGVEEGFVRYRVIPQLLAFFFYHVSWLLYVVRPESSYRLNADFEDRRERIWTTRSVSVARPITGSSWLLRAAAVRSTPSWSSVGVRAVWRPPPLAAAPCGCVCVCVCVCVCARMRVVSPRTRSRLTPRLSSTPAAMPSPSRRRPSSRCSVPM